MGIELVNDKNPPCLGVGFNRVGNMVSEIIREQRVAPIQGALPLPFGNVPIRTSRNGNAVTQQECSGQIVLTSCLKATESSGLALSPVAVTVWL